MTVPTLDQLPDLSGLGPNLVRMMARRLFQSAGPEDTATYALWMNAIRLNDLCVREYQNARAAFCAYHTERKSTGLAFLATASGHLEGCIWALERMLRHVNALRAGKAVPAELKKLLPKTLILIRDDQASLLISIRDAITHFEGQLLKGEIPSGTSLAIVGNGDNIEIGGLSVAIKRLAEWITEMHGCALRLADYGSEVQSPIPGSGSSPSE